MAQVSSRQTDAAAVPGDDLDDLFDYDVNRDDVLRDVDPNMDAPIVPKLSGEKENALVGIDEEVKIIKQRKPVPKLDEPRLLSQAGIPKLRRLARERLKFRGKGHEYSDAARLLNVYQLWLDDLYPRAKFADGLAMIEKLGHTKRMQTMRKEWINEGKPKETMENASISTAKGSRGESRTPKADGASVSSNPPERPRTPAVGDPNDDLYSASPRRPNNGHQQDSAPSGSLFISDEESDNQPLDDDLDLLLAEESMHNASTRPDAKDLPILNDGGGKDNFEDEMEALAGMDDTW